MKRSNLILTLLLLAIAPLLVYRWVSTKDKKYGDLVRRYECSEGRACVADFDGDGIAGEVVIKRRKDSSATDNQWLITSDGGKELLRLPFWYADNTLRSHAAVRNEGGRARLLIFWGAMREPNNRTSVYTWSGEGVVETSIIAADREVLSAMESRDDSGGFAGWVAFRLIRDAVLIGYYVLLLGGALFILSKSRRKVHSSQAEI